MVAEGTPDELKSSVGRSTLQLQVVDPADLRPAPADIARRIVGEAPVPTPEARRINIGLDGGDQAVDVLVALRADGHRHRVGHRLEAVARRSYFLALTGHGTNDNPRPRHRPEDPIMTTLTAPPGATTRGPTVLRRG